MTLEGIFSQLENISRKLDNKEGRIENIRSDFDKKLRIGKDEHDKVVSLIEQFEDSEKSMEQYDKEIEETEKSLKSLNDTIADLRKEIQKGTLSLSDLTKKQTELDDKLADRNILLGKQSKLESSRKQEENRQQNTKGRLNRMNVTDIQKAVAQNKKMEASIMAASKGGSFSKEMGSMKGNVYVMAAQALISAIEFGIGKATKYAKVAGENLMRTINATTTVSLNQMKASLDAWQDVVNGAYSSQTLAAESQLELLKAQNANQLASLKLEHTWTNWIPIWGEINKYAETTLEIEQQLAETRMSNAMKTIAQVNDFTKRTDDYIKKQDKAVHQYQVLNGLSIAQTQMFEKRMFAQGQSFAKFNKTIEDALKLQNTFTEQSGRAVNLTNSDITQSFAVGRLVGEDNLTAFQAQMQVFNHSVAESADIMYQMYKDANRMGLSQQKLVKNVLSNLKLANKYDFKNGTKGFIEFAKWAENARFNLGSLGSAVEKVQGGGLEGVITQAARLQVLGGRASMNADPMAMIYEANADPDAYAKRIADSVSDLGVVDRKTGEVDFRGTANMLIRQRAEAWGMNVEDLKDIRREQAKKAVVWGQMRGSTLTSKQKDLVANKAQRDENTGEWFVQTLQGERMNVNAVKASDLNNLKAENTAKNTEEYAQATMGFTEQIEASTKHIDSMLGNLTLDNFGEMVDRTIAETTDAYTRNAESIVSAIVKNREQSQEKLEEMLSHLQNIDEQYKDAILTIKNKGQLTEEAKGRELREHFRSGVATPKEYDLLKENPKYREGLSIEELKKIRQFDTRTISALWDWHRDRNWVAGVEGDAATRYRNKDAQEIRVEQKREAFNDMQQAIKDGNIGQAFLSSMAFGGGSGPGIYDGLVYGGGTPMSVHAANVTPIQDGSVKLARTDPQDTGLFAKSGGPFDKLFDGIFGRVNAIYDTISDPKAYKRMLPHASIEQSIMRTWEVAKNGGSLNSASSRNSESIDINLHGDIMLKTDNGMSFDISRQLETDPLLVRKISRLIAEHLSKSVNGGRGDLGIFMSGV